MKMSRFAWLPGRLLPTALAIGTRSTLAIVWLMNVETTYRQHVSGKGMGAEMTYEDNGCEHHDDPEFGLTVDQPTYENIHLVQQAARGDPLS